MHVVFVVQDLYYGDAGFVLEDVTYIPPLSLVLPGNESSAVWNGMGFLTLLSCYVLLGFLIMLS
jgi:hypothetical protein